MKKKTRILQNPYIILGILSLITGLILYSECIFGDNLLAYGDWGYDTKHSYLPAYEALVRGLKNHNIEFYDFSYGLGTTWAARMMLLSDPFCLIVAIICAVFDNLSVGILLVYMQLGKAIIAGEFCLIFLKQYKCSSKSSVLASYVFSFCGYMIATGQHYMYSTLPILAMLNLIAVRQYLIKRGKFFLIFVSALVANMGPYVAFPIYLMTAVYVCIEVALKKKLFFTKIFEILKTGLLIIVGLLISACSFLLQTYDILKISSRISDMSWLQKIKSGFFWVPYEYIRTGVLRFFSNNLEGTINSWNGIGVHFSALPHFFSILFILCIGQFIYGIFLKGTNRIRKRLFISLAFIFIFSLCNAFIPMMFSAFAQFEHRYVFVWLPFFALLMAFTLDQIFIANIFSHIANFLTTLLSLLAVMFMVNNPNQYVVKAKYVALFSLSACAIIFALNKTKIILKSPFKEKILFIALFIVVSVELLIDNRIVLYADRSMLTKESYFSSYWDPDMRELINYVNQLEGDNFVRLERTYLGYDTPDVMLSALIPYRSVSVYNSTLNSNIVEYTKRFFPENFRGATQIAYNIRSYGMPFDIIVATNLGIKYLVSDFERNIEGWNLVKSCNGRFLYENTFIRSAGLIYENAISQSTFEEMSPLNKKTVMAQAIILDDENIDINNDKEKLYYTEEKQGIIQISNQNGEIFTMGGMGNCNPIEVTQGNTLEILLDKEKINNKYSQAFLKATISSESSGNLSVIYNNGMIDTLVEIEPSYLKLEQNTLSREIILSLMQDTSMIKLSSSGTDIKIENIEVFTSLPMACSNDLLSFKNEKMGNIVKGDVELKNNGYLMMPIVYEAGWHVYVDGTEKNILRANFGLSAVEIKEGLHSVVFEYRSPILGIAIVLTCIGWGCSVGILFWSLYKKYKK